MTSINAVTLFSGLGSSSKALQDLGFNPLAHDFLKEAVASLAANGIPAVLADVREVDFTAPVYANTRVVAGGPPCQPFSQGGRNRGEDDSRDMIPDFQRAVAQTLPDLFLLENVKGLAGPRHIDYLKRRVSEFEAIGYNVEWRVLDAADYGVAQNRKRLFVLGRRVDLEGGITWPTPTPQVPMAVALGWDEAEVQRRTSLAPVPGDASWVQRRPSTTVVGSFRPEIQAAPGYRRAGDGPRQNAPGSVLTTPQERLILQGMPADWVVCGSKGKVDLQIGNSCPNPLLRQLLELNLEVAP